MRYLREVGIRDGISFPRNQFPFNLPVVYSLKELSFESPVTFFVGENGSGKSTLLAAIAAATGSVTAGSEDIRTDGSLEHACHLADFLRLKWHRKSGRGFFLRAEDFINFVRGLSSLRSEARRALNDLKDDYEDRSSYARMMAAMPHHRTLTELEKRYGEGLEKRSHGESFLDFFRARFVPGGLYLLDEPETPLSPVRQLALISMLKEMVDDGQFIIATHSPLLMAFPGADIYCFDRHPPERVEYEDLDHVNVTRDFLNAPERYLRHL